MKKVLLIEDNQDFRENTIEILELNDYEVIPAQNGLEGVEKAMLEKPDIIICDVMMPQLDGYGVINILTKNPETSSIPFIFLTAKAEKTDIRKGMNLGADDYLLKPFDEKSLVNSIETRIARNQKIKSQIIQAFSNHGHNIELKEQSNLQSLLKQKKIKNYKAKEELYREGDFPHYLYYVKSGKIKCQKTDSYGKTFVTQLVNEHEFFGYMPILEESEHSESALALDDSEVIIIPKEDFLNLIENSREVATLFFKLLSGNIKEKEEKLLQLAYAPVKERIARTLLKLCNGEQGKINISRDDLANIVGTAKESLVRNLTSFKTEGVIKSSGREITVVKPEELKRLIDLV